MRIDEIVGKNNVVQQTGKVKKITPNSVEIEDPKKPGVTTTVDIKNANVKTDTQGNTEIDLTNKNPKDRNKLKPNSNVTVNIPTK